MTKIIETAAIALGGLSLFAVSFVAFSVFSGKPLREIAVLGPLVDDGSKPSAETGAETAEPATRQTPRTEHEVVQASLGSLGTWSLPSPFTPNELRTLTDELKAKLARVDLREAELAARAKDMDAERDVIAERFAALEEMRKDLEAFKAELVLREQEVRRDEGAAAEREDARWASTARLIAELEDDAAARRLASYTPEEGALILLAMDEARATELVNQLEGDTWKSFVAAYSEAKAIRSPRR